MSGLSEVKPSSLPETTWQVLAPLWKERGVESRDEKQDLARLKAKRNKPRPCAAGAFLLCLEPQVLGTTCGPPRIFAAPRPQARGERRLFHAHRPEVRHNGAGSSRPAGLTLIM